MKIEQRVYLDQLLNEFASRVTFRMYAQQHDTRKKIMSFVRRIEREAIAEAARIQPTDQIEPIRDPQD